MAVRTSGDVVQGCYALHLELPLSALSRRWRRFRHQVSGRASRRLQPIRLPQLPWWKCVDFRSSVPVYESRKANGNIRTYELAILNLFARGCGSGSMLFEIGTFDGRTSVNLARSSPPTCRVYTLDLTPEMPTRYALAQGERHMVDKPVFGARIDHFKKMYPALSGKITQLYGDSATFDFSPFHGCCDLVFIDGSHAFDYVMSDTRKSLKLIQAGGVIVWHDYGIWQGVTEALESLRVHEGMDIINIKGTSLAYWRSTDSSGTA